MAVVRPRVGLILSRGTESKDHQVFIAFALEPVWSAARNDQSLVLLDDSNDLVVSRIELGLAAHDEPDSVAAIVCVQIGLTTVGDDLNAAGDQIGLGRRIDNLAIFKKLRPNIEYLEGALSCLDFRLVNLRH